MREEKKKKKESELRKEVKQDEHISPGSCRC